MGTPESLNSGAEVGCSRSLGGDSLFKIEPTFILIGLDVVWLCFTGFVDFIYFSFVRCLVIVHDPV